MLGFKAHSNSWVVGVQNPSSLINDAIFTIEHNDESHLSVATSGEYRNYYISNDEVISHTIDPVSGQSVQSESLSVTVKGNISCMKQMPLLRFLIYLNLMMVSL